MTDGERVAATRQKLPAIIKSLDYARQMLRKKRREHMEAWVALEHAIADTKGLLTLIEPYSKEELATQIWESTPWGVSIERIWMTERGWEVVATFASGYEADLAIAFLEAAGIDALRDSNTDTSGIFGPGFQGATSSGINVLVQRDALEDARAVLSPSTS